MSIEHLRRVDIDANSVYNAIDFYESYANTLVDEFSQSGNRPQSTRGRATLADLEEATSAWVAWYNTERLMHRLGRRPPAEAETDHYAATDTVNPAAHTN